MLDNNNKEIVKITKYLKMFHTKLSNQFVQKSDQQNTQETSCEVNNVDALNNAILGLKVIDYKAMRQVEIVTKLLSGTGTSDKVIDIKTQFIRLTGAILKTLKNFHIVTPGKVDKTTIQLGNLRRLLRINRVGTIIKQWLKFVGKKDHTPRQIFDNSFKIIMLVSDTADCLLYLMQKKVLREWKLQSLTKIIADFYFYECVVWICVHIFQYLTAYKFKSDEQRKTKRLTIIKFILDIITSHNDWSRRCITLDLKFTSVLTILSSLIGLHMIWN